MKVLIKQARIIDPASSDRDREQDIFIENGIIKSIGTHLALEADAVITGRELCVSPGWVDIFANFCDPGYEHKESLESGTAAAAAGGYTDVFLIPNTRPVIDNKSQVEYLKNRSSGLSTNVHPIGAISKNVEGKELAEMYDMRNSGAVAFSDGINPVQSAGLLLKALQYVKAFDGVVIQLPDDKTIGSSGLMNEGITSTRLGLAGKPVMAEELLVARDISLVAYTGSKLHLTGVTSPLSLDHIRKAKEKGLQVTCSVTPYHLFFNEEVLVEYDTNLKVYPPLRTEAHRLELVKAITDGTIDCIATHHMPQDYDSKIVEFEYAKNGMTGLETCYSVLKTVMPDISESRWVDLLSIHPRKIFGLPVFPVRENEKAVLTIFEPGGQSSFPLTSFKSKSVNTAFAGKTLKGKVLGVINGEKLTLNQ